ncbi:MAG TPA: peptide chain release factor N(5)-glutamine methyltransferase [Candidatus Ozemobacteraceae bacterium]|mgnify:CR=1 FL=1|nr:peptide chain release factor N(5)-glutamine methyltransferase [Candidatus Ozemobacteraceae bacterium]
MSVRDARLTLRTRFASAGIPDAEISADSLLELVLAASPGSLIRHLRDQLTSEQHDQLETLARRREQREPLQYLLGTWGFLDLHLRVAPGALIPRPETEDWLLELFDFLPGTDWPSSFQFVDVGTGTGAIGLSIAHRFREARGLLIDVSRQALGVAQRNLERHPAEAERIHLCQADLTSPCRDRSVHLIVSNPPYIDSTELQGLMPEVRDYEPSLALDGGKRGLEIINRLLGDACRVLKPGGFIALEHGMGQRFDILELAPASLRLVRTLDDAGKRDRAIVWNYVPHTGNP